MSVRSDRQRQFDPNDLRARDVVLVICAVMLLFVFGLYVNDATFVKWGGFAANTVMLYGYFMYDSRRLFRNWRYWALVGTCFAVHLAVFAIILANLTVVRLPWFMCMLLEVPIFFTLRTRVEFPP